LACWKRPVLSLGLRLGQLQGEVGGALQTEPEACGPEGLPEAGRRNLWRIWRSGSDGHYLWVGVDWNNFKSKRPHKQGLCQVSHCLEGQKATVPIGRNRSKIPRGGDSSRPDNFNFLNFISDYPSWRSSPQFLQNFASVSCRSSPQLGQTSTFFSRSVISQARKILAA